MAQHDTVYLDNAATTRVAPAVAEVVTACMTEDYGNPASAHAAGIAAERRVKRAREQVLAALGDPEAEAGDVYWTSGGTEADAIAVIGAARARANRGQHLLCSAIEHPAVTESMALLQREGWQVSTVPVTRDGVVEVERVAAAVTDETTVVALMLVNNELGTIQPVAEVARAVRERRGGVHIHCDAVQAFGKLPIEVDSLGVDSIALSAHKLHGPKGVGALWLRRSARLVPLWAGGGQQRGVRSGTENVPGIAGLGAAAAQAVADLGECLPRWGRFTARIVAGLEAAGVDAQINGQAAPRAPHILSLALPDAASEPLLHALEARGVLVSAGSACASQHKGPSHVLKAIGLAPDLGTLRISFGRFTTDDEVDRATSALIDALGEL
jgi:cysteine desulfurase